MYPFPCWEELSEMAELKYAGNQSLKYENYGARNPIQSCLPYGAPACLMLTASTSVSGTTRATSNAMPAVSVYQHINVFDMNFKTYFFWQKWWIFKIHLYKTCAPAQIATFFSAIPDETFFPPFWHFPQFTRNASGARFRTTCAMIFFIGHLCNDHRRGKKIITIQIPVQAKPNLGHKKF